MSVVEFSPSHAGSYGKKPLSRKEREQIVAAFKRAPLIRKKSEKEESKRAEEAEKMMTSLLSQKKSPSKKIA